MRKLFMLIMVVALSALPAMAQEWQSTSSMRGSGSAYSAQVTGVGAVTVTDMATTTSSYSGPKRAKKDGEGGSTPGWHYDEGTGQWVPDNAEEYGSGAEYGQSSQFPIGDAVLPLLLLACAYLGMRVFLKRKRALKS